jgi:pilus assembly protein CpaE
MSIYLLNSGVGEDKIQEIEGRLKAALPDLTTIQGVQEIERRAAGKAADPVFVLVAAPSANSEYFEKLINIVTRYREHFFFILISNEISATDYKRLIQSGGADWVSELAPPQEITDIIARHRARSTETTANGARPLVVTFMPSAGGVGNSTLALETAVQLKKGSAGRQRRVCLVDLDFQASHVCDYLDIEPRLQIQEIASNPERLDHQLFEIFISRHTSGLHVIAAPRGKFESWRLDVSALDKLFGMIAANYDCILIDLPVTWFPWTAHIVTASAGIVVTGLNTIPGLRQIAETLSAVRNTNGFVAEIRVALNRCEYRLLGGVARRQHASSVLPNEQVNFIMNATLATEAINRGVPMLAASPGQRINKQIAELAKFCTKLESARAARK